MNELMLSSNDVKEIEEMVGCKMKEEYDGMIGMNYLVDELENGNILIVSRDEGNDYKFIISVYDNDFNFLFCNFLI